MTNVQTVDNVRSVTLDNDSTVEKKSQPYIRKKAKQGSQNIALLLYPDNPEHIRAMAKVISKWDYTYIVHDKDEFAVDSDDDLEMHGGASDGDVLTEEDTERLKKKHIHLLIHLPSQKEPSQVAKELKLEQRFVQRVSNRRAMLCYLVHYGLHDKYQYDDSEVKSNRILLFREAIASVRTTGETGLKVMAIIQNKKCMTISFAMKSLFLEGFGDWALKHYTFIKDIVSEQKECYYTYCSTTVTKINDEDLSQVDFINLSADDELPF